MLIFVSDDDRLWQAYQDFKKKKGQFHHHLKFDFLLIPNVLDPDLIGLNEKPLDKCLKSLLELNLGLEKYLKKLDPERKKVYILPL